MEAIERVTNHLSFSGVRRLRLLGRDGLEHVADPESAGFLWLGRLVQIRRGGAPREKHHRRWMYSEKPLPGSPSLTRYVLTLAVASLFPRWSRFPVGPGRTNPVERLDPAKASLHSFVAACILGSHDLAVKLLRDKWQPIIRTRVSSDHGLNAMDCVVNRGFNLSDEWKRILAGELQRGSDSTEAMVNVAHFIMRFLESDSGKRFYLNRLDVEILRLRARRILRHAAQDGHVGAHYELGILVLSSRGEQDISTEGAAFHFRAAADQGHADAAYNLGNLLAKDDDTRQQAASWYRKAAEKGHAGAQYRMIHLIESISRAETESWCRKAAEQGHSEAQCHLGILCGVFLGRGLGSCEDREDRVPVSCRIWPNPLANALGNPLANPPANSLDKEVVLKYLAEGVRWHREAAERGHPYSQKVMALVHMSGLYGVEKDFEEASWWFRAFADNVGVRLSLLLFQTSDLSSLSLTCFFFFKKKAGRVQHGSSMGKRLRIL
jgi:TPR repeat protein